MNAVRIEECPIDQVVCAPQARTVFDEGPLAGLTHSVHELKVLQPIQVRKKGTTLVCLDGERRLRAAKRAGLTTVPVIVEDRELGEVEVTLRQLVLNTQRQSLTPIERARAYRLLIEESGWTSAEVARRTGFSEATVSRLTTLLTLPDEVLQRVEAGEIPASTAYQIAISGDKGTQERLASAAADQGLTREAVAAHARRPRAGRGKRKSRRSRVTGPGVVISLDDAHTLTVEGPGISIQAFMTRLHDLLNRFSGLEPHTELAEAVKALAAQRPREEVTS